MDRLAHAPDALSLPLVLRAGRSTYLVLAAIWAVPSGLVLAAGFRHPAVAGLGPMLGIIALYGATLLAWAVRFRIELNENRLIYTSLFGGRREISRDDIGKVTRPVGMKKYTDRFLPPVRLEISPRPGFAGGKIVINLKVFDREAIDALLLYLK